MPLQNTLEGTSKPTIAASPLICICPSLIALEEKGGAHRVGPSCPLRRAPKMICFPSVLTGQLATLIGQKDSGGYQDRAADNEGLTQ